EKARGLGIAGELLNRAEVTGELDGINSMSCTFLAPSQRDIMSFLQHMGFIVQERGAVPDEYNAPGMKEYIYIALKGEKYGDGEVTDYELMQMVPDAPFILPRFNELKAFFGENGYDAEEVIEEDELPYVSLGDNDNDIRFFIAPPEDDEPENFVIMARATVKVPKGKEKAVKDNFEKWQESCDVTSGFYDEKEGVLEYVAGLLAERQMPEKAMLVSFIETFLGDIKKLS
ncbi:MAG: hypothetical protein K6E56_00260, partial [Lachnospiraceae bacterium]|nr:hypothetical protein [Lachnospiraceae bacterium]